MLQILFEFLTLSGSVAIIQVEVELADYSLIGDGLLQSDYIDVSNVFVAQVPSLSVFVQITIHSEIDCTAVVAMLHKHTSE